MKSILEVKKQDCEMCQTTFTYVEFDLITSDANIDTPKHCTFCVNVESNMKEYDEYLENHPWVCGDLPLLEEIEEF